MKVIRLVCIVGGFAMAWFPLIGGCGGETTNETTVEAENDDNVRDATGICFGRVIDRSSRAGISSAVVEIFAGSVSSDATNVSAVDGAETNFVARVTTGTDDADTTLFDESGMWRIENLPGGGAYVVRIGSTGYATYQAVCTPAAGSGDNTPRAVDLGEIPLVRAVTATVVLTNVLTGAGIASCPVFATPAGTIADPATSFGQAEVVFGGVDVTGTTDSTGSASLSGINPLLDYTIVAPACDQNGDGVYEFQAAVGTFQEAIDSPAVFNVAVLPAEIDDTPTLIATSCAQYSPTEDGFMAGCAVPTTGALVYVFNYPIAALVSGQLQLVMNAELSFTGFIIWGGFGVDVDGDEVLDATESAVDTAFTAALSAGNTVLTVTPSAALTANRLYTLEGTITFEVPGAGGAGDITSNNFGGLLGGLLNNDLIYAFTAGDASINNPTADNYNSDDDGIAAAAVCLEFDEPVIGSVQVLATTSGAVTTVIEDPVSVNLNTGSLINEGNNAAEAAVCGFLAGCPSDTDGTCVGAVDETEAIKYSVPLGGAVALADNTAAAARSVTVYVDAMDYAGNQLQTELTLPVQ